MATGKKRTITIQVIPEGTSETYTVKLRYRFFEFLFYAAVVALFAMALAAAKITQIGGKVLMADQLAERNRELLAQQRKMELLEAELERMAQKESAIRNILQAFLAGPSADSLRKTAERTGPAYAADMDQYLQEMRVVERRLESADGSLRRAKYPDIWPVKGIVGQRYSQGGGPLSHVGIDIIAAENTLVQASAKGIVLEAGWDEDLGRYVKLDHDFQLQTVYGHLNEVLVRRGDHVQKGASLGLLGSTGNSSGPHLHFEVIFRGSQTDPLHYLP